MSGNEPDPRPDFPAPEQPGTAAPPGYQPPPPFAPPGSGYPGAGYPPGPGYQPGQYPPGPGYAPSPGQYPPPGYPPQYPPPGAQAYPPPGHQPPGYPPPGQPAGHGQPGPYQYSGYRPPAGPARPRGVLRRRSVLIAASVVAVFAVVGAVAATQGGTSKPKAVAHRLALPASFAGYSQVDDQQVADDLRAGLVRSNPGFADAYRRAQIGLYQSAAGGQLVAVAMPASVIPQASRSALARDPGSVAAARLTENGAATEADFPAGPLGGSLKCGPHATGEAAVCAWADAATVGLVLTADQSQADANQAAADTLSLRNAAEH
ncbi:MAG TPA: hypothetical protein VMB79_05890 [Jatrophihabitans sp.]|nr:hypothetical protein [Jatrophihabitans sp.]